MHKHVHTHTDHTITCFLHDALSFNLTILCWDETIKTGHVEVSGAILPSRKLNGHQSRGNSVLLSHHGVLQGSATNMPLRPDTRPRLMWNGTRLGLLTRGLRDTVQGEPLMGTRGLWSTWCCPERPDGRWLIWKKGGWRGSLRIWELRVLRL